MSVYAKDQGMNADNEPRAHPFGESEGVTDVEHGLRPNHGGVIGPKYSPRFSGWAFGSIDWGFVFASQHWATLVWAVIFLICLGISHWAQNVTERPFLTYDASISFIGQKDTIPASAAWIPPFGVLLVNLVLFEFFLNRRVNKTASHALATLIHFFLDAICCFICMRFIVEVTKLSAGRLRPDFLQDCVGTNGLSGTAQLSFANGSSGSCTTNKADSRKSFPSGHASSSMVTMIYSIVYCTWTAYFRDRNTSFAGLSIQRGWRDGFARRLWREFWQSALLVWNISQFVFGWAVGVTRFTNNKHNISDIVAGWYIGTVIALVFAIRAIGVHRFIVFGQA